MWEQFISLVDGYKLITLGILIGVDFVLGVIIAIKGGFFQFSRLSDYLNTSVLGFVGGYFLIGFAATVDESLVPAVTGSWVALDATLLAMVLKKAGDLGLPVPSKVI